jgi:hypothetical protein
MGRIAAASVVLVLTAGVAPGQWLGGGFGHRGGHGHPPRVIGYKVVGVVGGVPAAPVFVPPPAFGYGPPFGFVAFGPNGWNPYFLPPPDPVVVAPPPIVLVGFDGRADDRKDRDFLVIGPRDPPFRVLDRPAAKDDLPPAAKPNPLAPPPVLGRDDKPEADPFAEAARQVGLARAAFAADGYGRAAEHLGRAVAVRPDDPLPYFLKAQAEFAAGRYADAVTTIRAGMRRSPDWPASDFKPTALYGDRPARFDAHLAELRKAAAANPAEPAVQFLLAYQLWFGGQREAAVKLFRTVADRVTDAAEAERFLKEAAR